MQTLQLRHGTAHPELRTPRTLAALNRLTSLGLVEEADAAALRAQYLFLRRIESTLRRVENTSVSCIPVDEHTQAQLAKRLHAGDAATFLKTYQHATRRVRAIYDRLMNSE